MPAPLLDLVRARVSGEFRGPVGSRHEYHGPCPLCGGKDRFHVFPDQAPNASGMAGEASVPGGFWCRSCGLAGDYVAWLREVEGWDWKKIREFLGVGDSGGRAVQAAGPRQARREPQAPRIGRELADLAPLEFPGEQWTAHAEKFAAEAAAALERNARLLAWLAARGVTLACAKAFGLGWHAGDREAHGVPCSFKARKAWGLPEKKQNGRDKPLWLPRGLVMPKRRDGRLLGLRIRRPGPDVGPGGLKYVQVEGSRVGCFISPCSAKAYVVVEAQLCALAVLSSGVPDVGACAIESLQTYPDAEAAAMLGNATWIGLALDFEPSANEEATSDKARMKDGQRARSWWLSRFPRCERLPVPLGKDPGDFAKQAGLGALRAWIEGQLPPALRPGAPEPRGAAPRAPEPDAASVPPDVLRLDALMKLHRVPVAFGRNGRGAEALGLDMEGLRQPPPHEAVAEMSDLIFNNQAVLDWLRDRHVPGLIRPGMLLREA